MASDPEKQKSLGMEPAAELPEDGLEEEIDGIFLRMEPLESDEIEIILVDGGNAKPTFYFDEILED